MNSFRLRSGELDYAWWVAGTGEAVLLLHGFTGSKENWKSLGRKLSGERCVLAVDLPGHGESSAPVDTNLYAMPQVCAHLAAMLDHLDVARVDLLGYSMGGRLGLYFALQYPERLRSLVLESASPGLEPEDERELRRQADAALAKRIERDGVAAFVQEWERLPLFASQARLDETTRQALRAQRLSNRAEGLANSLRGAGSGVQPALWNRLGELRMPVMLVVGELDEKFVALNRRMASVILNARLEVVPQAGHTVHLEKPGVYENLLRNFWGKSEIRNRV